MAEDHFKITLQEREEEADRFYAAMGRAIASWVHVEDALFSLLLQSLNCPQYWPTAAAYHSVVNFTAKLDMVHSAFSVRFFGDPIRDKWITLFNRIGRKAKKRNKVAHFTVVKHFAGKPGRRYYLMPNVSDPTEQPAFTGKARPQIYLVDLVAYAADFRKVAADIGQLSIILHRDYGLDPDATFSGPILGPPQAPQNTGE